jgi:hypothetical protein
MKGSLNPDWNDEQIVDYFRHWGIEHWKCGIDGYAANRVYERHLVPAGNLLEKRGSQSLAKLLPLLGDENRSVRLMAAGFAYDVEKSACRKALEELMQTPDNPGLLAYAALFHFEGPEAVPNPGALWGIEV